MTNEEKRDHIYEMLLDMSAAELAEMLLETIQDDELVDWLSDDSED
jgi:hypothetical protein